MSNLKGETMPKFFVKTNQIEENKIKIIGEDVKHINQVLRAKIGEELTICNLDTTLNYITTISQITPEYVMCDIQDCVKSFVESNVQVTIFQGLPKADKMEYIIQKNTELGAKQIVPVEMVRCVVKLDSKKEGKKIEGVEKIKKAYNIWKAQYDNGTLSDVDYTWLPSAAEELGESIFAEEVRKKAKRISLDDFYNSNNTVAVKGD